MHSEKRDHPTNEEQGGTKAVLLTIDQIVAQSPTCNGYEKKPTQMAFYSVKCCWWTSHSEDLGDKLPIPHCPHCMSPLFQAPLHKFVNSARRNPAHYGPKGLEAFASAHSRNVKACAKQWRLYPLEVKPE